VYDFNDVSLNEYVGDLKLKKKQMIREDLTSLNIRTQDVFDNKIVGLK